MPAKITSQGRFSGFAVRAKISSAISPSAASKKSIAAYVASSSNAGQDKIATRSVTQWHPASLDDGSRQRFAASANKTRSVTPASRRRPEAARRSAGPIPRRSHS